MNSLNIENTQRVLPKTITVFNGPMNQWCARHGNRKHIGMNITHLPSEENIRKPLDS